MRTLELRHAFTALVVLSAATGAAIKPARAADPSCQDFLRYRPSPVGFVHDRGARGARHLPETMGAGLAAFDWDGDGWLDLYFVQSGPFPPGGTPAAPSALYRQEAPWVFRRVALGAAPAGYGQGVLAADFDGDGDQDLLVTSFGPTTLLENRGDGSLVPAPLPAAPFAEWGSSMAAADGDGDGDLDVYVTEYLDYDPLAPRFCGDAAAGLRDYCDPSLFDGLSDRYLRNEGGLRFRDAAAESGLAEAGGRGLGVVFTDLDGDRRPELFVANDLTINLLFHNQGGGRFVDRSLESGAAVSAQGRAQAGMGVQAADLDHDGDADLLVTNFDVETNSFFRNDGGLFFEHVSAPSGFGLPSFNLLGFGIVVADLDLDGALDVLVANGHIFERPGRDNTRYRQPPLLLVGDGSGRFSQAHCEALAAHPGVGRGAVAADLDLDGDQDVVLSNNGEAPTFLENTSLEHDAPIVRRAKAPAEPRWLAVELVGRPPNRDGIGAVVALHSGERRQVRAVAAGTSYQSSEPRRVTFGVEDASFARELRITWPSGGTQRLVAPPLGVMLRVIER